MQDIHFERKGKKCLIAFEEIDNRCNGIIQGQYTLDYDGTIAHFNYGDIKIRNELRGILFWGGSNFVHHLIGQKTKQDVLFTLPLNVLSWIDETENREQEKDGRVQAIEAEKQYIRKVTETLYSDGYNIPHEKYVCDHLLVTAKKTIIQASVMFDFLAGKNIDRILVVDAVKMWAEEKEEAHLKAQKIGLERARAIFEDDEADAGYDQACDNAGIDKFLR